jgi:fatty-acyl-CoA synthase
MYHNLIMSLIAPLLINSTSVYPSYKMNIPHILEAITKYKCNTISISPKNLLDLFNSLKNSEVKYDISSIEFIISSGQPISQELINQIKNEWNVHNIMSAYGMTEIGYVICTDFTERKDKQMNYAGKSLPFIEFKVVDEITREIVPFNEIGQLMVRGYSVTRGYFNNEEKTKDALDSDGWYSF